ncbi:MAG: putative ABC transport system ATP-binding protein [Alteromonadaceae bacterium]|jgi:putative ABC transport system ATP-binding protein
MSCSIELKCVSQSFENIVSVNNSAEKNASETNAAKNNASTITLFKNLDLSISQGQSYAITGPSGSGKSSLLMLLSGLEAPTSGQGTYINGSNRSTLDNLRSEIGFIFQQFHLLPELTALHNIALPLKLRGDKQAIKKAQHWLEKVGLSDRAHHNPSQLSGGEQQRVAIARALVFSPKFIFADEPTGNLDQHHANEISDILFACCQENNAGLIIVTHSNDLASKAQNIYSLTNGELTKKPSTYSVNDRQIEQQVEQVTSC